MITFGDVRPEIRRELYDNIERVANSKDKSSLIPITRPYPGFNHTTIIKDIRAGKSETSYFIVMFAKWVMKNLHTYLIISNEKPKKMLDTIVFDIKERKDWWDMIECLPKDIPTPKGIEMKPHSAKVFEDGKDMPLIY
jgi:hypothetical protein